MKKKILLDTNVPNAYFDYDKPDRQQETIFFWNNLDKFDIYISEITLGEIIRIEDIKLKNDVVMLIRDFERLLVTEEAIDLANKYIMHKVLTKRHLNDLLQIAIATVNNLDALLSWNFEHIVKESKIIQVNLVNELYNYRQIKILPPPMAL